MSFFEAGKRYRVRVTDLHSPDAETFSVSLNDLTGRYPINEDVVIPGELINVLLDATVPHEIVKMERGYPRVVGVKLRPRFSVTPVGMPTVPVADATIIRPGISSGGSAFAPPSDDGSGTFDPTEGAEPAPDTDGGDGVSAQYTEESLSVMVKGRLIDIAQDYGLSYTEKNNKSEIITGILTAVAMG